MPPQIAHKSAKTVLLRMNGVAPGFLREYGCRHCPQCSSQKPQAHISASLFIKETWENHRSTTGHVMFDCGIGAIDSLIDFGAPEVSHLFISHGHPYHSLGLDRLVWGQVRHGGTSPIPLFCTAETCDSGPRRIYPWFFADTEPKLVHYPVSALSPVVLDLGVNLRITPVSVYQGQSAPGAVIWVVEFGRREWNTYHKLILGWELVHFIPRFPDEDLASSYRGPVAKHNSIKDEYGDLLLDADELFFDGNTVLPRDDTHHMSVEAGLRFLIPQLRPPRTWIVHYSGHEDPGGPLSDDSLQEWVDREKQKRGLRADIRLGKHGMELTFEVA